MAGDAQTMSLDTVAVLVAALLQKGVTLSHKEYNIMSKLDGKRGAASFDHQFRKIKTRAKELQAQFGDGTDVTPAKVTPRKGAKKATGCDEEGTPVSKKRGRKTQSVEAEDDEETPAKKIKAEVADEEEGDPWA